MIPLLEMQISEENMEEPDGEVEMIEEHEPIEETPLSGCFTF